MKTGVQNNSGYKLIFVIFVGFFLVSCGGGSSSSSSSDDDGSREVQLSLDGSLKNVELEAGKEIKIKFTYTIPSSITGEGDFRVNLTETLLNASLSATPSPRSASLGETLKLLAKALINDALAAETAQVTAYISYAGDTDVCSSSTKFGPYDIAGEIGMALTSSQRTVKPTQRAIDIMNSGALEVCLVTTPPIDAFATVTAIAGDVEPCEKPQFEIADSTWSGTFRCDNFGTPDNPPGSLINLSITRLDKGRYKYTDDGGAVYRGHFCGNTFRFNGGLPGSYTESGTLVFANRNEATKTSTWNGIPMGSEGGDCKDKLTRN